MPKFKTQLKKIQKYFFKVRKFTRAFQMFMKAETFFI